MFRFAPCLPSVSEIIWKTRKEGSSGAFIAAVASAIIGTAIIAALIGLFIYRRRNTQSITQLTQRQPPGLICLEANFNFQSDTV